MNYRIETKGAFPMICKKRRVSSKAELTPEEISRFWRDCNEDGTIAALCQYIPEDNLFPDCVVGASFGKDASDKEFPYAIGACYNGLSLIHI